MPTVSQNIVHVNAIPEELRALNRWVCWAQAPEGKVPKNPLTGCNAKCNDPATWDSFDVALKALRETTDQHGTQVYNGLSFALSAVDDIVGIDLDSCRNPHNKSISGWALKIIQRFNSYTEVTPSGTGIRIFVRGKLTANGRHKGQVEVYDSGKFLTVTGRKLITNPPNDGIQDRAAELVAWHREVFGDTPTPTKEKSKGQLVINDPPVLNQGRLDRLFRDKPKAREIFDGKRGYPSQSEADLALANYAVRTGWTDQAVCDLLVTARINADVPIKPVGYFERTIAKAREGYENRKSEEGGAGTQNRSSNKGGAVPRGPEAVGVVTIEEAREVYSKHLYLPDPDVVDVVLSVPAGNRLLETDPLWLFLKGPPGSGKTELLTPLRELPEWAVLVSNLTPAALISGYGDPTSDAGDQSLLPQLNGKCLVIKDFTTILAMNPMQRDEIYGIFRDVYDGHAAKNFGTGRREYKSRFNLIAGVTSAIERAWQLSALGERFLAWSMTVDHKKQARQALSKVNHEVQMRADLAKAAAGVLAGLPDTIPTVSKTFKEQTLILASLLARLRTYVARDRNDVVHTAPEVEVPTRIVKQLLRLGQSVALVRRRDSLTGAEFRIMRKVALDSVPSARLSLFNELLDCKSRKIMQTVDYFADKCRISHTPAKRHLDDMILLGLVDRVFVDHKLYYKLTNEVQQEWQQIQIGGM